MPPKREPVADLPKDALCTANDACAFLSVSKSTLKKLVDDGLIPRPMQLGIHLHRYSTTELHSLKDRLSDGGRPIVSEDAPIIMEKIGNICHEFMGSPSNWDAEKATSSVLKILSLIQKSQRRNKIVVEQSDAA